MHLSLLACTWNRSKDLRELLDSALSQDTDGSVSWEIIVVDNCSNDGTRELVNDYVVRYPAKVRYFFEPRQGKAYALNTALQHAAAPICTIADDDLVLPSNYVQTVTRLFDTHPDVALVGGKVLPLSRGQMPRWLTRQHWAPLAMLDFGDSSFYTGETRPICLMAAAFRKNEVLAAGGYDVKLGVSANTIGGVEDAELYSRLYKCGIRGLYEPSLCILHKVEPHRATKSYHRRWHFGHGRQLARTQLPEFRGAGLPLEIPLHLYRAALLEAGAWLRNFVLRRDDCFYHETRLWWFAGFVRERMKRTIP